MCYKIFITSLMLILLVIGISFGQEITLDHVDGLYAPETLLVNQDVTFYLRLTGDANSHGGITNGFRIYSPEGAEWNSLVADTLPLGWGGMFDLVFAINLFATGSGADTVGFGGSKLFSTGLPANFDEVSYTITIGPIDPSHHGKTIVLDSSFYGTTGFWKWAGPEVFPEWDGPHQFTIFDPDAPPPASLEVNPASLSFTAEQFGGDPASQSFTVSEINSLEISYTSDETASWMTLSNPDGTTPGDVTVNIQISGLTAGTYNAPITVTSDEADNSPLSVDVTLEITEPPKVLVVEPQELFFTAFEGQNNPASQQINVSEQNNFIISYEAFHDSSWVVLTDSSGTTPAVITVDIETVGLTIGSYIDTIKVISDEEAQGSPEHLVVVNLNILSSSGAKAIIKPGLMYAAYMNAVNPMFGTIHFGNFDDGHTVNDIDAQTVIINVNVVPESISIISSHPDFVGEVMEVEFLLEDFLIGYGAFYDSLVHPFTISGNFSDGQDFSIDGVVVLRGHTSGDLNLDGIVDIEDLVIFVHYSFFGGPEPEILELADINHDGIIDIEDIILLVIFMYY